MLLTISPLTDSFEIEKSIRFTLPPKGNRIDFSDFSPWGWGIIRKIDLPPKSVKVELEIYQIIATSRLFHI